MKVNSFRGDLTDVLVETKSLVQTLPEGVLSDYFGAHPYRRCTLPGGVCPDALDIHIGGLLSQAPVIDMKCNFITGMGAVARSPFASAIYHHR